MAVEGCEVKRGVAVRSSGVDAHAECRECDGEYGGVARLRRLQDPSERAALRGVFPQVRGVVLVLQGHELDLLR